MPVCSLVKLLLLFYTTLQTGKKKHFITIPNLFDDAAYY